MAAARYCATAAGADQLEVFSLGRPARARASARVRLAREGGLYNGLPARWPCLVAAARYCCNCATAAGADQLEVFLTGTARTRQSFGPGASGSGRWPVQWPACPVALSCGRGQERCNSSGPVVAAQLQVYIQTIPDMDIYT